MGSKALVLDANILVRGFLGNRVRQLVEHYSGDVTLHIPDVAHQEAYENLPSIVLKRRGDIDESLALLNDLTNLCETVELETYGVFESDARERLGRRDPDDWPILATALAIGCPIWTED